MTETPLAPEASVIVPSRGGAQRLPRLIGALATQEDAPPFEVHVVVDGDVDGSEAVLAQSAADHPSLDLSWTASGRTTDGSPGSTQVPTRRPAASSSAPTTTWSPDPTTSGTTWPRTRGSPAERSDSI